MDGNQVWEEYQKSERDWTKDLIGKKYKGEFRIGKPAGDRIIKTDLSDKDTTQIVDYAIEQHARGTLLVALLKDDTVDFTYELKPQVEPKRSTGVTYAGELCELYKDTSAEYKKLRWGMYITTAVGVLLAIGVLIYIL